MNKEKIAAIISLILLSTFLLGCTESSDSNGDNKQWGSAPMFTMKTLDGRNINLSNYLGKIIILDFMAVDCQYCVYQTPILKEISNNYSKYNLQIISIDVYSYETEVYLQSFINWFGEQGIRLNWTFGLDKTGEIASKYISEGEGIPKLFIIDTKGNIYYTKVGYTEYSVLAEQLNKLIK
jgi:thiol-disulfide isomerase/thioredoxin